jgi:small subunit ribosomal protein S6
VREYETTVIVQPEISSTGTEAILQKMDSALERGGSTRLMCADLGKRKLAYEIHKFHKGHYYTLSFVDAGQVIPELERVLRMEESVLRFMTVMVDDSVTDLEVRVERGRSLELEQQKRAVEKTEREAEEARAREEVERLAAAEAAAKAAAAPAEASAEAEAGDSEAGQADPQSEEVAEEAVAADAVAEKVAEAEKVEEVKAGGPSKQGEPAEPKGEASKDAAAEDGEAARDGDKS